LLPLAIKLSLPCSAFELVSYTNNTGVGQGHPLGYITYLCQELPFRKHVYFSATYRENIYKRFAYSSLINVCLIFKRGKTDENESICEM